MKLSTYAAAPHPAAPHLALGFSLSYFSTDLCADALDALDEFHFALELLSDESLHLDVFTLLQVRGRGECYFAARRERPLSRTAAEREKLTA